MEVVVGLCIEDPFTGTPLVLHIAVPQLRFGLRVCRWYEVTRNTGALLGAKAAAVRQARLAGWELAHILPNTMQMGDSTGGPKKQSNQQEVRRRVRAFLLEQTRLPQLLAGP
jgi:hypothetical protein